MKLESWLALGLLDQLVPGLLLQGLFVDRHVFQQGKDLESCVARAVSKVEAVLF